MSYCRWSSDDYNCDLYCYEDVRGGFTTHVANTRIVGDVPKLAWPKSSPATEEEIAEFLKSNKIQREFFDDCKREKITLPYAGETFNDSDLESFRDRLLMLREVGYRFSDGVLEAIEEDMKNDS